MIFIAECLQEMPERLEIRFGNPAAEILAAAREQGTDCIVTQRTPDPLLLDAASQIDRSLPVIWTDPQPFVEGTREFDLKRFSHYWQRAQNSAMQPTRR